MAEVIRLFPEPSRLKRPRATGGHDRPGELRGADLRSGARTRKLAALDLHRGGRAAAERGTLRFALCANRSALDVDREFHHGRRVVGKAERGEPAAIGKWARARAELQVTEWFGEVPDFILGFDASYAAVCSDAQWCALVEHELSHWAVERDIYGAPKFRKATGLPAFTLVGHDVEEFVGVRRHGAAAASVQAMIDAAAQGPTLAEADIEFACGNCAK
jgi:hypothetical protein